MMNIPALKRLGGRWKKGGWVAFAVAAGLLALALRVWGVGWSLPYVDHPDEPNVIDVALRIAKGQLNPAFFDYPSLVLYLQALVLKLHLWWGLLSGRYGDLQAIPSSNHLYTTIPAAFVWARSFTALLGAATSLALAAWGARYVGRPAALIAALLLAASPWAVVHSHYATVDIPAALTSTLALLAIVNVLQRGRRQDYLLAGVLIGLATSSKYTVVVLAGALAVAHVLRWRRQALAHGVPAAGAGLAAALAFFATSPYILLDFAEFRHDMEVLVTQSYNGSHGDVRYAWPVGEYLLFLWSEGLGPLPALLAIVGTAALVRQRPALAAVLLSFPLLLLVALLRMQTHFFRNLLPLQPALLLLAGFGAATLWEHVRGRLATALARAAAALALAALLLPPLSAAAARSADFARPDSRVAAQAWARRERPGVRVASELSHPLLWDGIGQATHIHYLPLYDMSWYRQQGYGLLLASSHTRRSERWTPDYQPLLAQGQPLKIFGGPGSELRGPRIDLIDTGLTTSTLPTTGPQARIGPVKLLGVNIGRLVQHDVGPERQPGRQLRAGDVLAITAFWTVDRAVPESSYVTFVHLRDQQGRNLVQRDVPPWLGLFPPSGWRPGRLVAESLDLALPTNLPPGEYSLVLGMYDGQRQVRYVASAGGTQLMNDEVSLGMIEVVP